MHKLTLDPSTQFGWSLLLDDSNKPEEERRQVGRRLFYGTWDLTRDEDGNKCTRRGQYAWNLWHCFNALMRKHGIAEDAIEVVLEGESYGSQKSEAGRQLAAAWLHTLEMMAERKPWGKYPRTCPPSKWRKAFIGRDKAPDEIGEGLKDSKRWEARREWLKQAVLAECHKRGLRPQNDNEADALGMMFWLVRGGAFEQDKQRAEKKAKASAKRAQKKLDLQVAA